MEPRRTGPPRGRGVDLSCLRRGALATSVLDDVPMEPRPEGVAVGPDWHDRGAWVPVSWRELAEATHAVDPESPTGRIRLRDWMRARPLLRHGLTPGDRRIVPLGLPPGHPVHPGAGWAQETVRGGVLELGPALRLLRDGANGVVELVLPLSASVVRAAGVDVGACWPAARAHLDAMGSLAVARLERDGKAVLAPVGGCDALTLLGSATLRRWLADSDGTGMRAVAVPIRSRGWFDLARIDPPFVLAAAHATSAEERGVERPLLVTADEVATGGPVIDVARLARRALADPAADDRGRRDVLYR